MYATRSVPSTLEMIRAILKPRSRPPPEPVGGDIRVEGAPSPEKPACDAIVGLCVGDPVAASVMMSVLGREDTRVGLPKKRMFSLILPTSSS